MAAIHDMGKSVIVEELSSSGSLHEAAGVEVAEGLGIPRSISKICRSHSSKTIEGLDIEEVVVRLADKLWKGKRDISFEQEVTVLCADLTGGKEWEMFMALDDIFNSIADLGHERLEQSRIK